LSWLSTYKGKKVFLTGHTGFKGSWLSQWLLKLGAEVVGYSKDIPTNPSMFEVLGLGKHLKDIRADIRDLDRLEKEISAAKPDILFHFAAQPLVRASYENPLETFFENSLGTANVLEALRLNGSVPAAVIITTDKVYENNNWEFGYREIDPLGGHDPYSASKAAAEIITSSYVRSFFTTGTRICSARAGNVIGGGDWAKDRLVPDCIRAWNQGKAVEIRNPSFTRPWEHVLEPLGGYMLLGHRLLKKPESVHGEAFNFGPSGEVEKGTEVLVKEMEKYWPGASHRSLAQPIQDGKKEAQTLRLNCDKAAQRLGWQPTLSFEETVGWTAEWYLRQSKNDSKLIDFTHEQVDIFSQGILSFH
jgi:CDP-glucose 4,6-dehydratase